jgi:hypothetical protein
MLTAKDRAIIGNDNATNQQVKLEEALGRGIVAIQTTRAASATAASTFVAPIAMKILFVTVRGGGTAANGTLLLSKGASAVTNAMACAAADLVAYASTIVVAQDSIAAGETLTLTAAGSGAADVTGVVTIYGFAV